MEEFNPLEKMEKPKKKSFIFKAIIVAVLLAMLTIQVTQRVERQEKQDAVVEETVDISADLRDINWELRDRVWVLSDALNKAQTTIVELESDNQSLAKENLRLLTIIEESGDKDK
jgi:hypothetical protein